MAKVLCVILAALASFMLVESLECNKCNVALLGVCLNSDVITCAANTSQCFTGRASFPNIANFAGINQQGCRDNCTDITTESTVLSATLRIVVQCCNTDRCNPVTISGATTTTLSLAAVLASALLASAWSTL